MILDILIGVPMIIFTVLGLRDGIVRKLVALVVLIIGLILGQIYMRPVGSYLADHTNIDPSNATMYGFLTIYMSLAILQGILYRVLTGGYKLGGVADRIGGIVVGFIEGAVFLSSLLFIFAMSGFPSRDVARDSRFYKPIVNIAPEILDFTSTTGPETLENLKELGKSATSKENYETIDSLRKKEARLQNEVLQRARSSGK